MHSLSRLFLACIALCWSTVALAVTAIDNVRVYRAPEYTRFVFDVSETPKYQVLPDLAPGRVVIDFRDAALKAKLESVDLKDSPVRRVRSGQQADGTTRVVLDLAVAVRVNSFALPPNELYGNRLVVDLYDLAPAADAEDAEDAAAAAVPGMTPAASPVTAGPAAPGAAPGVTSKATLPAAAAAATEKTSSSAAGAPAAAAPAAAPLTTSATAPATAPAAASAPAVAQPVPSPTPSPVTASAPPPPAVVAPAPARTGTPLATIDLQVPRRVVVAIDAGHGGEDPGARGPKGTREKDVVLAIARAVRDRMREEPGMRPVMIRDGDYYVGLKERRTRARKKHDADLFVSIHADAFTRREARGASVFAVSRRGATSTLAAYLANSENRADLVGGIDPRNESDLISVISDMMMEGTMRESLHLGRGVLDELGTFARLHKHSVEQAGFMVLKEPNMPSILVETGFISNPEEERLLGTAAYQQRIAGAIVNGVRRYFERSPPPGTWFAARRDGRLPAPVAAAPVAVAAAPAPVASADVPDDTATDDSDADEADDLQLAQQDAPAAAKPARKDDARKAAKPAAKKYVKHKVGKGQSLGWLAGKYGVTQREIKEANGLKRDDIRIGETLKIPVK